MRLENGDVLFQWPLALNVITAGWTYNSGKAHNAIDLRAAIGTPAYAAAWQSMEAAPTTEERLEALEEAIMAMMGG